VIGQKQLNLEEVKMPAMLRRLCSDSSSDGFETMSPCSELATPIKRSMSDVGYETPIKRRRLTIVASSHVKSKDISLKEEKHEDLLPLAWTVEDFARSTPSRTASISEQAERKLRMKAADKARALARAFLDEGSSSPAAKLLEQRVQALACYHVQLFFMTASVQSEDADIVAIAATFASLKALNIVCFLEDVLVVFHVQNPATKWSTDVSPKISEVESRMTQLADATQVTLLGLRQICAPRMALDYVANAAKDLIGRLPESKAFCRSCGGSPETAAQKLSTQLTEAAQNFAVEAMLGPVAVLVRPVVVARVVVVMAARRILQLQGAEVNVDELMGFMTEVQGPPGARDSPANIVEVRHATKEIIGTCQLREQEK